MAVSAARRHQTLIGAGALFVGALLAWGARTIPGEAGYSGVGPNFLPWVVAAVLMVCGLVLVVHAQRGGWREVEEPSGAARGDWVSLAWVAAGIAANAALLTTIGFILSCTLCYLLAVQGLRRAQGQRPGAGSLAADVVTGLAIAAPVYWMFTKFLAINLPGLTATGWI